MKFHLVPVVAVAVLALSGCAASAAPDQTKDDSPAAATHAAASPTPSTTPVAEPTAQPGVAVDPAQPSTWTIDFGAIGPVEVGETREEALTSLATFPQGPLEDCPAPISAIDLGDGVAIWLTDDTLTQIVLMGDALIGGAAPDSRTTRPLTAEGIGVGSTTAELLAAYPDAQTGQSNSSEVYSLGNDSGEWINFQAMNGVVDAVVVNDRPSVNGEYCG
jgi:hypothetical protein